MASTAILAIKVLADTTQAQKALAGTASSAGKFQAGLSKAVLPAAAVAGALAGMGGAAISAASDLQQAQGGVDSVFKGSAAKMHEFAQNAAQSAGLSESAYSEMATIIGSQLKNAGVPMDQLAGKTNDLITTGADMAAMFGGTSTQAVEALSSALKGEMDPIEKYGVTLSQTAIKAEMVAQGTDKLTGKQAAAAKQSATLALITRQTADAHGKFASETDTAAGAQQIANANMKNTAATLGTILLPAFTAVVQVLSDFAKWMGQNKTLVMSLAAVLGTLALAVLAVNAAMKIYAATTKAIQAATKIWAAVNFLLGGSLWAALGPILLIIAAVAVLAAGIIYLWRNNAAFRNFVIAAWKAIQSAISNVWRFIKTAAAATLAFMRAGFSSLGALVRSVWNSIRSAFAAVAASLRAAFNGIRAVAASVWNSIRSTASAAFNGIRGAVNALRSVALGVWNAIRSAAASAFGAIRAVGGSAINALLGPIHAVAGAWQSVVNAVSNVVGWISRIHFPSMPSWMSSLGSAIGLSAPPTTSGALAPSARGATARSTSTSGGSASTVINVTGALDPDAVARQISSVLTRQNRRRNGVDIGRTATIRGVV